MSDATEKQVTIFHQTLTRGGGMEQYGLCISKGFQQAGWRVVYYAQNGDESLAASLGIELRLAHGTRGFGRLRDWFFSRQVRRDAPGIAGLQIALSRVPVRGLAICGGTHRGYLKAVNTWTGPNDRIQIALERSAYASASKVISHSLLCAGELRDLYGLPSQKVVTIFPAVDAGFSPGDAAASRRALDLPNDKTILLFPSTGHKRKGLFTLLEALQPLGDKILLLIAGKPVSTPAFARSLGYVGDMKLAYRAADFTVLASVYEPFGLVGPESVLCGTRVIFDKNIGCLPALSPEASLSFDASSPPSIRAAVERAIELKKSGAHKLEHPGSALLYDPNPASHIAALAEVAELNATPAS